MNPKDLEDLAQRIDHEELWRRPGLERDTMTQEQRDRLDAAVNLRRYASQRGVVVEALKQGREYMRGFKFERADDFSTDRRGCGTTDWHGALNGSGIGNQAPHWMYTAKMISDEVPRMILLFEYERTGRLQSSHRMCSRDPRPATELGYIDWPMAVCWTLIAICVAFIPVGIYAMIQEQHEWEGFAAAHACRVIGHMEGSTSTGVGPSTGGNGGVAIVVTSNPGKIGYQCDDGQQYWRNE